jgi:hypothetical protein
VAHGLGGNLIGVIAVAKAHGLGGGNGSVFYYTNELHCEVGLDVDAEALCKRSGLCAHVASRKEENGLSLHAEVL